MIAVSPILSGEGVSQLAPIIGRLLLPRHCWRHPERTCHIIAYISQIIGKYRSVQRTDVHVVHVSRGDDRLPFNFAGENRCWISQPCPWRV